MLVLSRRVGERIVIGDEIELVVVEVRGGRVRLGIECPRDIRIVRQEIWIEENSDEQRLAG